MQPLSPRLPRRGLAHHLWDAGSPRGSPAAPTERPEWPAERHIAPPHPPDRPHLTGTPPDFSPCSLHKSIACSSRSRSSHRPLPAWNVPPDTAGLPPLLRALLGVIFPSGLPGCCSKQGPDPLPAFSLSSRHFFRSAPHPTLFTQHLELSSEHSRHSTRSLCEWVSKQNGSTACEGLGVTLCVRASEAPSQDATHPSTPAHGSNQTSHGLNLQQV